MCDFPLKISTLGRYPSAPFSLRSGALRYFRIGLPLFSRIAESDFPFLLVGVYVGIEPTS